MSFEDIEEKARTGTKVKRSYTINKDVIEKFDKIASSKKINKSTIIEGLLELYIKDTESLIK